MKTIDIADLPEPVAHALEVVVETLREQFRHTEKPRQRVELPAWPGEVTGGLTRTEIYQDVG